MDDEWHDHRKTVARLAGEIAALRCLVESIASCLPERAMYAVGRSTDRQNDFLQDKARQDDTDGARDMAAGFYDVAGDMRREMDEQIDALAEGSRIRMVHPAKIADGDMLFPDKGW